MVSTETFAYELTKKDQQLEEKVWTGSHHVLEVTINTIGERIKHNPYSAFDHYLLSQAYMRLFNDEPTNISLIKKANELAQQAIELNPTADFGTIALASILSFMGQPARGIKYIGETMEAGLYKNSWRIYFMLGQLNAELNNSDSQLAFYKKSLNQPQAPREIIIPYIIETLKNSYHGPELTKQLLAWNKQYSNHYFAQELAVSYAQNEKYHESDKMFAELNKGQYRSLATLTNHAILLYQNLERAQDSLKLLKSAQVKLEPDDEYRKTIIEFHIASANLKLGRYKAAQNRFSKLIIANEFQSDFPKLLMLIEKSYEDSKDSGKYLDLLVKLTSSMGSAILYEAIGRTADSQNHYPIATDAFKKAIIIEPEKGDLYNLLGLSQYKQKDYEDALLSFDSATKFAPDNSSAHYNKACILSILRRTEEALGSLENAFMLDPNLKENALHDSDFANIKNSPGYLKITSPTIVAH